MVSYVRGHVRTLSDAEIVAEYVGGKAASDIAARANCTPDTVLYLVRRAGHEVRGRVYGGNRKVLPLPDSEICRLYRDGVSGTKLAERCATTANTIYGVLRRNGVERRTGAEGARIASRAARAKRRGGGPS